MISADLPDAGTQASALGISKEAVELYQTSEVIDLHVDSFIWNRVFGYDLTRKHGRGPFGARYMSQVDFPRILEARIGGATWVITTNPGKGSAGRRTTFFRNLDALLALFRSVADRFRVVRDRKSTRLNSSHMPVSRMPSSA